MDDVNNTVHANALTVKVVPNKHIYILLPANMVEVRVPAPGAEEERMEVQIIDGVSGHTTRFYYGTVYVMNAQGRTVDTVRLPEEPDYPSAKTEQKPMRVAWVAADCIGTLTEEQLDRTRLTIGAFDASAARQQPHLVIEHGEVVGLHTWVGGDEDNAVLPILRRIFDGVQRRRAELGLHHMNMVPRLANVYPFGVAALRANIGDAEVGTLELVALGEGKSAARISADTKVVETRWTGRTNRLVVDALHGMGADELENTQLTIGPIDGDDRTKQPWLVVQDDTVVAMHNVVPGGSNEDMRVLRFIFDELDRARQSARLDPMIMEPKLARVVAMPATVYSDRVYARAGGTNATATTTSKVDAAAEVPATDSAARVASNANTFASEKADVARKSVPDDDVTDMKGRPGSHWDGKDR